MSNRTPKALTGEEYERIEQAVAAWWYGAEPEGCVPATLSQALYDTMTEIYGPPPGYIKIPTAEELRAIGGKP